MYFTSELIIVLLIGQIHQELRQTCWTDQKVMGITFAKT